jgi:hypothetical protein
MYGVSILPTVVMEKNKEISHTQDDISEKRVLQN